MHRCTGIILLSALAVTQPCRANADEEPVIVGKRRQLFVDDYVVAELNRVKRVLQSARKENASLPVRFWTRDKQGQRVPLNAWIYASPYYDPEFKKFRMWSRVNPDGRTMRYGYSESADGVDFEFVSELKGIVSNGDYNSVVYIDPHETDPAHHYKIGYDGAQPPEANGACLAYSADGLAWTPYNEGRPVTGRAADFTNCLIWDGDARTYRLFTRTDFGTPGGSGEIRGMRGMINADVKAAPAAWKTTSNWHFQREQDEHRRRQLYCMTDWMYCGVHFGLMGVYEWPGDFSEGKQTDHRTRHERDVLNYYLATSRDGDHWNLNWVDTGAPLVERGGEGAWDKDLIVPSNWIITHADKHWLYYGGANERHGTEGIFAPQREAAIGLASLRLDGFVALEASGEPGTVLTKPFQLVGDSLEVNVDAKLGEVALEILGPSGEPIPGFSGKDTALGRGIDELRWRPTWGKADRLGEMAGKSIRLKFRLHDARLYAFRVQ